MNENTENSLFNSTHSFSIWYSFFLPCLYFRNPIESFWYLCTFCYAGNPSPFYRLASIFLPFSYGSNNFNSGKDKKIHRVCHCRYCYFCFMVFIFYVVVYGWNVGLKQYDKYASGKNTSINLLDI